VHRYLADEKWWDIPDAEREQDARYQSDSWEEYIAPWLIGKTKVLISEVLEGALGLKVERHDRSAQIRVGSILRRLKWVPKRDCDGDRKRYYTKITKLKDKHWT
jgi:putative DNA primase/helicase